MQKIIVAFVILSTVGFLGWQKYTEYTKNKKRGADYAVAAGVVCSSFVDRKYLLQENLMDCIRDKEVLQSGVDKLVQAIGSSYAKKVNDQIAAEKFPTFIDLSSANVIDFATAVALGHAELLIFDADIEELYLLEDVSLTFTDALDLTGNELDEYELSIEKVGSDYQVLSSRPLDPTLAAAADGLVYYCYYMRDTCIGDVYYRLAPFKSGLLDIEVLHFDIKPISEEVIIAVLRSDLQFRDLDTPLMELNPNLKEANSDLRVLNKIYSSIPKAP